jgi:hypothetical protein
MEKTADWLKPGLGCNSESEPEDPSEPSRCDWETQLRTDEPLAAGRRLVIVHANHLTGSGSWDYVRVYGCVAGHKTSVLQEDYRYGVSVQEQTADRLVLVGGNWEQGDALCCPSARIKNTYTWESKLGQYTRTGSEKLPLE